MSTRGTLDRSEDSRAKGTKEQEGLGARGTGVARGSGRGGGRRGGRAPF